MDRSGIDTAGMWKSAVAQTATIAGVASKNTYLNLQRPYLTYTLTEAPLARINYKNLYTVPSLRFTTYQQDTAILGGQSTGRVNFEYINVDSLSSLVCLSVFDSDRDGQNGATGARQPRMKGSQNGGHGNFVTGRKGCEYQSISCPIRWDTLKINLSVANSVLGSVTGGLETEFDMYRVFLKYSKTKVSFSDWKKYCQMLVFSPMELCSGGMGLETNRFPYLFRSSTSAQRPRTCCALETGAETKMMPCTRLLDMQGPCICRTTIRLLYGFCIKRSQPFRRDSVELRCCLSPPRKLTVLLKRRHGS